MLDENGGADGYRQGGYPTRLLKQARDRWDASAKERRMVEKNRKSAHPLASETPKRAKAYIERLITQVGAASASDKSEIRANLDRARDMIDLEDNKVQPKDSKFVERVIGEAEEFLSVLFVKQAAIAANAVGRVISNSTGQGFGTGFLVAPGILMTNEHVLTDKRLAEQSSIQFLYETEIDNSENPGHVFRLEPERLFFADKTLDMAIIAVAPVSADGKPLGELGQLPLIGVEGKIRKGAPVNIVQHPMGKRKQIVFRDSFLTALPEDDADSNFAHYSGDTLPGSSGSPVFSDKWEVVALHHAGVPDKDENGEMRDQDGNLWDAVADPEQKTVKWVANEGIRISRIMKLLRKLPDELDAANQPGADLVRQVLAVSEWARKHGVFAVKPAEVAGFAEANRDGTAEMRQPERTSSEAGGARAAALTIPLVVRLEIGDLTQIA